MTQRHLYSALLMCGLLLGPALAAMAQTRQTHVAARVYRAVTAAGVPIVGLTIGDATNKATWRVQPDTLQGAAQSTIDAFDITDPVHELAELDAQVKSALDTERLTAAVVWMMLKQIYPGDTDAQTKTKFGVARTRIITVYTAQPWK